MNKLKFNVSIVTTILMVGFLWSGLSAEAQSGTCPISPLPRTCGGYQVCTSAGSCGSLTFSSCCTGPYPTNTPTPTATSTPTPTPTPPPYNLAASYRFQNSSQLGQASMGSGLDGTNINVTYTNVNTPDGGAGVFDGSSAHITIPHSNIFNAQALTFSAWIKPINFTINQIVWSKMNTIGSYSYQIGIDTNGYPILDVSANGTTYVTATGTTRLAAGIWQKVTVSYQAGTVKFYVNSIPAGAPTITATSIYTTTTPIHIGRQVSGSKYFGGSIDEVCLYGSVLSDAQITVLADKICDGQGTVSLDLAGFGSDSPAPACAAQFPPNSKWYQSGGVFKKIAGIASWNDAWWRSGNEIPAGEYGYIHAKIATLSEHVPLELQGVGSNHHLSMRSDGTYGINENGSSVQTGLPYVVGDTFRIEKTAEGVVRYYRSIGGVGGYVLIYTSSNLVPRDSAVQLYINANTVGTTIQDISLYSRTCGQITAPTATLTPTPTPSLSYGTTLSSKRFTSCRVNPATGGAQCSGNNIWGQLGNGTNTHSSSWVNVTGLSSGVLQVTTGYHHSCALTSAGGVKCWGNGWNGQVGNGQSNQWNTPQDVTGLTSGVVQIVAGHQHTCAVLSTGALKCWGLNGNGQLGVGNTTAYNTPQNVTGMASGVAQVSADFDNTCALKNTGEVFCWGWNAYGQVGDATTVNKLTPTTVTGLTSGYVRVASGTHHACAVATGGTIKCWGANWGGQLGNGNTTNQLTPVDVLLINNAVDIEAGDTKTFARLTDGSVMVWGDGAEYGSTGNNDASWLSSTPQYVYGMSAAGQKVSAGTWSTCLETADNAGHCVGANMWGQFATGNTATSLTAQQVTGLTSGVSKVVSGRYHSCALTSAGGVKCWGWNPWGNLGNGTQGTVGTIQSIPADVVGLTSGVADISAGFHHGCAVVSGGAKCWGHNGYKELGNGTNNWNSNTPTNVSGLTSGVAQIVSGAQHACARLVTGSVKCWGTNTYGQLGDGTTNTSNVPVTVSFPGGALMSSISTNYYHTCGLSTGGVVYCWGWNAYGQIGDGTTTNRLTPTAVSLPTTNVTALSAGGYHTCVVESGAVKCWSTLGSRIGINNWTGTGTPQQVVGLTTGFANVNAGFNGGCAWSIGGVPQCWGEATFAAYPLTQAQWTDWQLSPIASQLSTNTTAISLHYHHGCGIIGGSAQCWGMNNLGVLGNSQSFRSAQFLPMSGYVTIPTPTPPAGLVTGTPTPTPYTTSGCDAVSWVGLTGATGYGNSLYGNRDSAGVTLGNGGNSSPYSASGNGMGGYTEIPSTSRGYQSLWGLSQIQAPSGTVTYGWYAPYYTTNKIYIRVPGQNDIDMGVASPRERYGVQITQNQVLFVKSAAGTNTWQTVYTYTGDVVYPLHFRARVEDFGHIYRAYAGASCQMVQSSTPTPTPTPSTGAVLTPWLAQNLSSFPEEATSAVADTDGIHLYITGRRSIGYPLGWSQSGVGYVQKIRKSDKAIIWTKEIGDTGQYLAGGLWSVDVDSSNIYVSGYTLWGTNLYVAKLDKSTGAVVWETVDYQGWSWNINTGQVLSSDASHLYIAGTLTLSDTDSQIVVYKKRKSDGATMATRVINPSSGLDHVKSLEVSGNDLLVGGGVSEGLVTGTVWLEKLATANLSVSATASSQTGFVSRHGMLLDPGGNDFYIVTIVPESNTTEYIDRNTTYTKWTLQRRRISDLSEVWTYNSPYTNERVRDVGIALDGSTLVVTSTKDFDYSKGFGESMRIVKVNTSGVYLDAYEYGRVSKIGPLAKDAADGGVYMPGASELMSQSSLYRLNTLYVATPTPTPGFGISVVQSAPITLVQGSPITWTVDIANVSHAPQAAWAFDTTILLPPEIRAIAWDCAVVDPGTARGEMSIYPTRCSSVTNGGATYDTLIQKYKITMGHTSNADPLIHPGGKIRITIQGTLAPQAPAGTYSVAASLSNYPGWNTNHYFTANFFIINGPTTSPLTPTPEFVSYADSDLSDNTNNLYLVLGTPIPYTPTTTPAPVAPVATDTPTPTPTITPTPPPLVTSTCQTPITSTNFLSTGSNGVPYYFCINTENDLVLIRNGSVERLNSINSKVVSVVFTDMGRVNGYQLVKVEVLVESAVRPPGRISMPRTTYSTIIQLK